MVAIRFAELLSKTDLGNDFVKRSRAPSIPQLGAIIFSVALITVSVHLKSANHLHTVPLLLLLFGILAWYIILTTQRTHDLLLTTEFQNALFASALGLNNKFCVILKRDGSIVYIDRAFQHLFPEFTRQSRRSLDVLLSQSGISDTESQKIYSAIERGIYEKTIFEMTDVAGNHHKIVMAIEPILRPKGFILLRGREFVERGNSPAPGIGASAEARADAELNPSTITLFSHVMDTMHMGVYMTTPTGTLIYINPVLEQWLGYDENEINARSMVLQDIVNPAPGGVRVGTGDYEGEVTLAKKDGGQMRAFINQKIIRDENNRALGITAVVHNFATGSKEVKKKLW